MAVTIKAVYPEVFMNKWSEPVLVGIGILIGVGICGGIAYYCLTRPKESTSPSYPTYGMPYETICPPPIPLEPEVILVPVPVMMTEIHDEPITEDIKEHPCTHPETHDETTCYKRNGIDYIVNHNGEEELLLLS